MAGQAVVLASTFVARLSPKAKVLKASFVVPNRNRYNEVIMAEAEQRGGEAMPLTVKAVSLASLLMSGLLLTNYFMHQTFTTDGRLVYGFAGFLATLGVALFIPALRFGKAHAFYLYVYHWLLAFLLLFITPTLSYYLYLWVMLMYMAEYFYQAKGTILSSLALISVMITGSLYQYNGLTAGRLVRIFSEFLLIFSINLVLTKLSLGNRQERKAMAGKIVRAEYEHGRMVALINSMSDAVIATDEKGIILTYNAAALDLLDTNLTLSDLKISDVLRLTDANNKPIDALELAQKTIYLQRRADLQIPIGSDDHINLDISISRITRSTLLAKQQGFTFLLRDITQQKSLDEERDLFISEVSHELRTPITIAEGEMSMAALLADKPQPKLPEIKASIGKAHDQVVFLADMVNDLSALSRAQQDDQVMDIETFSVSDVLSELEETYRPQAEKKGLYLKLELAPVIPKITTSRLYFKEVMQNFVTNAIKYTQTGGVIVRGQAVDRNTVIISVIDTGIGISKSEQARVYQKFWRSEDPYTRSTGGTGLGLFITARLAHRIGAELRLESKPKVGSTFAIILPVQAVKPVDQANVVKNEVANLFS